MAVKGSMRHFQTLLVSLLALSVWAEMNVKKCFKGTEEESQGQASLSCPAGTVISIHEALLGSNKWFECVLTEEDCVRPTKIFRNCEGLNYCNKSFSTYSARCSYITILLIRYECIPVTIPTTPVATTTSSNNMEVGGRPSVGIDDDDGDASVNGDQRDGKPYYKKDSKEEDDSEVGLLIATICASLITGVMLIIAIVMTIRRILNYPTWLQNRNNSSRWDFCMERACLQVDKFPCFSGADESESSPEQALRSQSKAPRVPLSTEDTVPNLQRTRMTPIGQEASDSDVAIQPNNIVNRNDDLEGCDISEQAQTPGVIEDEVARSSFKLKQQNQASVSGSNESEHCDSNGGSLDGYGNTQIETVNETLNEHFYRNNAKSVSKAGKSSKRQYKSNQNNNNVCKDNYSMDLYGDEQGLHIIKNYDNHTNVKSYINNNNKNNIAKKKNSNNKNSNNNNNNNENTNNNINNENNVEMDYSTIESKYSAIVVPNTETSSRC